MRFFLALLVLVFSAVVCGQDEVCYCAPSVYEFTLDFDLTCPPVNITLGDAVSATTCIVSPFGDTVIEDLVPVAVQTITVIELRQDLQVLAQSEINGNFANGDTFQYTSTAADPASLEVPIDIPVAIQLNILGVNAADESIINVFLITFTGNCDAYPVLFEGQYAGWTRFSDLQPPRIENCPMFGVPGPSEVPSTTPTGNPTPGPVTNPITPQPATPQPTMMLTAMPTTMPTAMPTMMSISMSMSMSVSMSMSMSMSMPMDFLDMEGLPAMDRAFEIGTINTVSSDTMMDETDYTPTGKGDKKKGDKKKGDKKSGNTSPKAPKKTGKKGKGRSHEVYVVEKSNKKAGKRRRMLRA